MSGLRQLAVDDFYQAIEDYAAATSDDRANAAVRLQAEALCVLLDSGECHAEPLPGALELAQKLSRVSP